MSDVIIRVENLGKKYMIGHQAEDGSNYVALRDVLAEGAWSLVKGFVGRGAGQRPSQEEFWALKKELSQRYGFKIIIPSNDHEPKHVHVFKGDDDYAKIEIETLNVVRSYLKPKELKQALKIIQDNQSY